MTGEKECSENLRKVESIKAEILILNWQLTAIPFFQLYLFLNKDKLSFEHPIFIQKLQLQNSVDSCLQYFL